MADHRGEDADRGGPHGRGHDAADHAGQRQRLLDRLTIGDGILCGLRLEAAPQGALRLGPGVALDPRGRELVVTEPVTIHPHRITDEAGAEVGVIHEGVVTIALAHRPRAADAGTEAGARDSVAVLVLRGGREPAPRSRELCDLIAPAGAARREPPIRRLARFLEADEGDCFDGPGPDHVVLGRVTLEPGGKLRIDPTPEAGRRLLISGSRLLDLLLCLWEKLEEQEDVGCRPSPPPLWGLGDPLASPPTATPHPAYLMVPKSTPPPRVAPGYAPASGMQAPAVPASMKVVAVEFLDEWGRPQGELDRLIRPARFPAARGIGAIQVTFSRPLDPGTCTAIEPAAASLLVRSDRGDGHVPGTVSVQGNVARFQVNGGRSAFPAGEYEVTLFGDEDPTGRRPAIAAQDRSRLDGEARALPSGDGREGGNFVFRLRIGDD